MAVTKERVEQMAEEMGFSFSPYSSVDGIVLEKGSVKRSYRSYQSAYRYLYSLKRRK